MNHGGFTEEQIAKAKVQKNELSVHEYESPEHTTNIFVDEDCIKKQKPHRKPTTVPFVEVPNDELKRVHVRPLLESNIKGRGSLLSEQTRSRFFGSFLHFYCEMVSRSIDCDSTSMASERFKLGYSRFLIGTGPYR